MLTYVCLALVSAVLYSVFGFWRTFFFLILAMYILLVAKLALGVVALYFFMALMVAVFSDRKRKRR